MSERVIEVKVNDEALLVQDVGGRKKQDPSDSQGSSKSSLSVPSFGGKPSLSVPSPGGKSSLSVPSPGGLFPLPASQQVASSGSATGNSRNKVALKKGFSLMDWVRLTKSGKDLTGVGGPRVKGKIREVSRADLRKHRTRKDAWMAINGAVFNVTPYMDYHPGGWDELMKGAGMDATDLFNEVHRWVNYESLLEACLVGKLVDGPLSSPAGGGKPAPPKLGAGMLPPPSNSLLPPLPASASNFNQPQIKSPESLSTSLPPISDRPPPSFALPAPQPPSGPKAPPSPTFDFFQSDAKLTLNIYCKRRDLTKENFIVDNFNNSLRTICYFPDKTGYLFHYTLCHSVQDEYSLRLSEQGKLEIVLVKQSPARWQSIGSPADSHGYFGKTVDMQVNYRKYRVTARHNTTHDTLHFTLKSYAHSFMKVPPGKHIHVKADVEGMEVTRSYTPVVDLFEKDETGETLQLLIKIYPDGAVTPRINNLQLGDDFEVSDYTGDFHLSTLEGKSTIYLICGGTGITPMLSLLPVIQPGCKVKLINFNKTSRDVIWKDEINRFANEKGPDFQIFNIFSQEESCEGQSGRISTELLRTIIQTDSSHLGCVCGPTAFVSAAENILKQDFNFQDDNIHLFQG